MSRQQAELNHDRRWLDERIERSLKRMEANVKSGNALKRIIESERQETNGEQTNDKGPNRRIA